MEKNTLEWFRQNRKEQFEFASEVYANGIDNPEKRNIVISAPVKSGKREITEIICSLTPRGSTTKHVYLTQLHRRDTKAQHIELQKYQCEIIRFTTDNSAEILREFKRREKIGVQSIIHFDESDYGTGGNQVLATSFKEMCKLQNTKLLYYSATNEEVIFSDIGEDSIIFDFAGKTAPHYCGADWFLDNNLVHAAEPFWDNSAKCLTEHGRQLLSDFKASDKLCSVVRFVVGIRSMKEAFKRAVEGDGIEVVFVDQSNSFDWSMDRNGGIWNFIARRDHVCSTLKVLFVVCQTATRSTEVGFHKHIYFWHDFRSDKSTYNTMHQAMLRVAHYNLNKDTEPNLIKVYGNKAVFELAARRISKDDFLRCGFALSQRINDSIGNKAIGRFVPYVLSDGLNKLEAKKITKVSQEVVSVWKDELTELLINDGIELNEDRWMFFYTKSNNKVDVANNILTRSVSEGAAERKDERLAYIADGANFKHTASWDKLVKQYPEVKEAIDANRVVAFVPFFEGSDEDVSVKTSTQSMYQA